jgi:hypothetical protein
MSQRSRLDESVEAKSTYERKLSKLVRRKEALEQLEQEVQRRSKEHAEQVQRATAALEARDSDVRSREEQCRAAVEEVTRTRLRLAEDRTVRVGRRLSLFLASRVCLAYAPDSLVMNSIGVRIALLMVSSLLLLSAAAGSRHGVSAGAAAGAGTSSRASRRCGAEARGGRRCPRRQSEAQSAAAGGPRGCHEG